MLIYHVSSLPVVSVPPAGPWPPEMTQEKECPFFPETANPNPFVAVFPFSFQCRSFSTKLHFFFFSSFFFMALVWMEQSVIPRFEYVHELKRGGGVHQSVKRSSHFYSWKRTLMSQYCANNDVRHATIIRNGMVYSRREKHTFELNVYLISSPHISTLINTVKKCECQIRVELMHLMWTVID